MGKSISGWWAPAVSQWMGGLEASSWPPNWSLPFWVGPGTAPPSYGGPARSEYSNHRLPYIWYSVSLICDLPLERDFKWKWGKRKLLTLSSRANKSDSRKCCVLCGWVELTLWHWTTEKLTHTHTHTLQNDKHTYRVRKPNMSAPSWILQSQSWP